MTKFLKRVWLTVKAAPMYLTVFATAVGAFIADPTLSSFLPAGTLGLVARLGAIATIAAAAGGKAVTLVTPVAADLRGFPQAPASTKERLAAAEKFIADIQALAASAPAVVAEVVAEVQATAPASVDVPAAA